MPGREPSSPSLFTSVAALAVLLLAGPASAVSIALAGPGSPVVVGNAFSITVDIAGLGGGTEPTLSAFELAITYDAGLAAFTGATFGSSLGIVGTDPLITSLGTLNGPTRLAISEASFLSSAVLDAKQPAAFTLVTLDFSALAPGLMPLALQDVVLADTSDIPGGNEIVPSALLATSVTLVAVPESAPMSLLTVGITLLWLSRPRNDTAPR